MAASGFVVACPNADPEIVAAAARKAWVERVIMAVLLRARWVGPYRGERRPWGLFTR